MSKNLDVVLKMFGVMWLITAIGFIIGSFLPIGMTIAASVLTLVLIIAMYFVRNSVFVASILAYLTSLMVGVTLYVSIGFYAGELGMNVVLMVVITCTSLFALLGFIGYRLKRDLGNLQFILVVLLFALIIFSIASIFIGFSDIVMLLSALVGILIFIGFTIYEFNQIAHDGIEDDEVPFIAISLYLNLVNLILQALKFVYYLKKILD